MLTAYFDKWYHSRLTVLRDEATHRTLRAAGATIRDAVDIDLSRIGASASAGYSHSDWVSWRWCGQDCSHCEKYEEFGKHFDKADKLKQ